MNKARYVAMRLRGERGFWDQVCRAPVSWRAIGDVNGRLGNQARPEKIVPRKRFGKLVFRLKRSNFLLQE